MMVSIMSVVASGQKRGDGTFGATAASTRERLLARESEITNRELDLRRLRQNVKAKKPSDHDRKLILNQIFEDFEHIQLLSRELTRTGSTSQAVDYKRVSHLADNLNHRAKRFIHNLGLPPFKRVAQSPQLAKNEGQVRALLLTINPLVRSLVTNPFFQNPKVADSQQFIQVGQGLNAIVQWSQTVKKSSDKLKK